MAKTEKTKFIESALWKANLKMGTYGCFEVTIGVGWSDSGIVDFITYDSQGEFRCYEIKVSKADFKSKAKTSFEGDFNYYVMPSELYEELRVSAEKEADKTQWGKSRDNSKAFNEQLKNWGVGLITVSDRGNLFVQVKPKRKHLKATQRSNLLESIVRSQARELQKFYKIAPYWEPKKEIPNTKPGVVW